jgi:hypothetical protein
MSPLRCTARCPDILFRLADQASRHTDDQYT